LNIFIFTNLRIF